MKKKPNLEQMKHLANIPFRSSSILARSRFWTSWVHAYNKNNDIIKFRFIVDKCYRSRKCTMKIWFGNTERFVSSLPIKKSLQFIAAFVPADMTLFLFSRGVLSQHTATSGTVAWRCVKWGLTRGRKCGRRASPRPVRETCTEGCPWWKSAPECCSSWHVQT